MTLDDYIEILSKLSKDYGTYAVKDILGRGVDMDPDTPWVDDVSKKIYI